MPLGAINLKKFVKARGGRLLTSQEVRDYMAKFKEKCLYPKEDKWVLAEQENGYIDCVQVGDRYWNPGQTENDLSPKDGNAFDHDN